MIYTRYGIKVKIVKYNSKTEYATLKGIECNWKGKRHTSDLRADRGWMEIEENINNKGQ